MANRKKLRAVQLREFAALKKEIDVGLADIAAGRLVAFDISKIIERGRQILAARSITSCRLNS